MEDCDYNTGYKCLLGYTYCLINCPHYSPPKEEDEEDIAKDSNED
jgi:hypothetical protein